MKEEIIKSLIDTLQTAMSNMSEEIKELKKEIYSLKERATIQNARIIELEGTINPFISGE